MDPIWTLFSRRTRSQITYWLSALGYDLGEHSLSNSIYLVYFFLFWFIWLIAVFSLLGNTISSFFQTLLPYLTFGQFVVYLGQYLLAIWFLVGLRNVTKRSPFIFNTEDAYLLCQTPVSRSGVAIASFVQRFIPVALTFGAEAALLSFTMIELEFQSGAILFQFLKIFISIMRLLIFFLPMRMGLQAITWGVGALRLGYRQTPSWMLRIFPVTGLVFLTSFLYPDWHTILMSPLRLPLEAAILGEAQTLTSVGGGIISFLILILGFGYLSKQSRHLNLSRAAEETRNTAAIRLARQYAQYEIADGLRDREHLNKISLGKNVPVFPRKYVLVWKEFLQYTRLFRITQLFDWLIVFCLSLGIFLSPDLVMKLFISGVWTIRVGSLSTKRLRLDLSHWWLLRSLPLQPYNLLLAIIAPSWTLITFLGYLAAVLSHQTALFGILMFILLPLITASTALATGNDILKHSKTRLLLSPGIAAQNVPHMGFFGAMLGLISVLLPLGIFLWGQMNSSWILSVVSILLAAVLTWINFKGILSAYRLME